MDSHLLRIGKQEVEGVRELMAKQFPIYYLLLTIYH